MFPMQPVCANLVMFIDSISRWQMEVSIMLLGLQRSYVAIPYNQYRLSKFTEMANNDYTHDVLVYFLLPMRDIAHLEMWGEILAIAIKPFHVILHYLTDTHGELDVDCEHTGSANR